MVHDGRNYYGIVLTNASSSTVKVYGKNGSNLYSSGFSFDSTDDGTNITSTGANDDLYFLSFAVDKAVFNGLRLATNTDPGDSSVSIFINDNASKHGKTALFLNETFVSRTELDFPTNVQTGVRVKMSADELIYIDYADDGNSQAGRLNVTVYFTFIDRPLNG